jgi:hypothetical protein
VLRLRGEDTDEVVCRPERWLDGAPEESKTVPGIWSHLLTSLGGFNACIGFPFSLPWPSCLSPCSFCGDALRLLLVASLSFPQPHPFLPFTKLTILSEICLYIH